MTLTYYIMWINNLIWIMFSSILFIYMLVCLAGEIISTFIKSKPTPNIECGNMLGYATLKSLETGSNNIALGSQAGNIIHHGSHNTKLGN